MAKQSASRKAASGRAPAKSVVPHTMAGQAGASGGAIASPPQSTHAEVVENSALYYTGIFALVSLVISAILAWGAESVQVVGSWRSLGGFSLLAALVVALIVAPIAYMRGARWRNRRHPAQTESNWRWRVVPVTVGAVIVTGLAMIFAFIIVNAAFPDVRISAYAAPLATAIMIGAIAYFVARAFYYVRAPGLLVIVVIALMGTLMFAGALNDDPLWYEGSFSGLGMTQSNSRSVFNVGLIITGMLIIAWSQFLLDDLAVLVKRGFMQAKHLNWLRILFIVAGIFLAMVGVVRWGIGPLGNILHDVFAGGAGVALGIVLVGMYWFIPHFPKWFYYISWGMLALIVGAVILKIVGLFSLTGIELYGFGAACLWLLIFMRSAQNLVDRVEPAVYNPDMR